ncbi:coiled-coil domain-containing protein 50 [Cimex lectularius]|uniref:Coiled-coil domain-containing protein n=1 Tax=Cimex lectularius TaxID=79782 RepID=A0A8I6RE45_CIMLE|nr:coiled-coil domain-containing protein 50 [Cimex lectularius]
MTEQKGVNEVCREWSVREDNALAYQLQQLEVERHYSGNKSRNAIVRQDCRIARHAQRLAHEEAQELLRRKALREQHDAEVARAIAERLEREECEKLRRLEVEDQRIAKQIQDREKKKIGDFNSIGLPLPSDPGLPGHLLHHSPHRAPHCPSPGVCRSLPNDDIDQPPWPAPPQDIDRLEQEKLDEELAKRLQLEEETSTHLDRDRLLAIEVQDTELAKMLHQKEKARAKKIREKARNKAALKKQMEEEANSGAVSHNLNHMPNIAMAIDPTYVSPEKHQKHHAGFVTSQPPPHFLLHPDILNLDEEEAPPYMPVQGQKRSAEKKKKK